MLPPDALGLGLRPPHYTALAEPAVGVDYLEILLENYVGASTLPLQRLDALEGRYPLVGHGVSLNLLGADPLDRDHLAAVKHLVRRYDLAFVTDHLCWSRSGGHHHHDLLPSPYAPSLVPYAAERARIVQDVLEVPFGIENVSSYVQFDADTMPEWAFYAEVVDRADCGMLLDLNNVFVSAHNHGFDPTRYVDALDLSRVLQVHLAGHTLLPSGLRQDTHDHPVADEVWSLYRHTWARGGPFPTLLEWDDQIPPLADAVAELHRAKGHRS